MIVVIAIIGILSAILIPFILGYIEKSRNTADVQNAHDICNALEAAVAVSEETVINYDTPWKNDPKNKDSYQINFVLKDGGLEFSYTASVNGKSKAPDTSKIYADRLGGKAGDSNIELGGKN